MSLGNNEEEKSFVVFLESTVVLILCVVFSENVFYYQTVQCLFVMELERDH